MLCFVAVSNEHKTDDNMELLAVLQSEPRVLPKTQITVKI